jgi:hypothetical protein
MQAESELAAERLQDDVGATSSVLSSRLQLSRLCRSRPNRIWPLSKFRRMNFPRRSCSSPRKRIFRRCRPRTLYCETEEAEEALSTAAPRRGPTPINKQPVRLSPRKRA